MKDAPARCGILCVTDRHATGGRPLLEVVRAVIEGDADLVQVRERDLPGGGLLRLTKEIVEAAHAAGSRCRVVVNDRLDVALAAKAAGVHLPEEGLPIGAAKRHVPKKFIVGRSVHSLAASRQAGKEGADYLVAGPVFETPSKIAFGPPLGPAVLRKIAESVRCPVFAIGGIGPDTIAALRGIPIAGIAAVSALMAAPDPAGAVRSLRAALESPPPSGT